MKGPLAIVTGCDATYHGLLKGAVESIRATPLGRDMPLCVFDAGFTDDQSKWLTDRGAVLARPEWSFGRKVPGFVSMLAARPRIPDYFPGHQIYMWIDADA